MKIRNQALLAAALLATAPAVALAQPATNTADPYATTTVDRDDDDEFPWGLLGLLGLAGLLGMKRHDDDHRVDRTANDSKRM